jgi:hypothetical protein
MVMDKKKCGKSPHFYKIPKAAESAKYEAFRALRRKRSKSYAEEQAEKQQNSWRFSAVCIIFVSQQPAQQPILR